MLIIDGAQLAGFIAVATLLVVTPGPNTLLIVTNSVAGGRSAGIATVLGVETGTLVHTIAAAVGISALLVNSAVAFEAITYVGAASGFHRSARGDEQRPAASGTPGVPNETGADIWAGALDQYLES